MQDNGNALEWGLWPPRIIPVIEQINYPNQIQLNNQDQEDGQSEHGSEVSSDHSDHAIPDLNINVIYEVEMAQEQAQVQHQQ